MTLDDLCSYISDDLRYRDKTTADYAHAGKALIDLVLALPPGTFGQGTLR